MRNPTAHGDGLQVMSAPRPKKPSAKRALSHMHVEPAENGGGLISSHFKPKGRGMNYEEPQKQAFSSPLEAANMVHQQLGGQGTLAPQAEPAEE